MIYLYLFTVFFRIGIFSFGGGLAMLPLIFQSVQSFGIMSAHEFSNLVALSQVTPGPIAVNAATYVGFNYAGLSGAAVATLGVCVPSFILVLLVVKFIEKFNDSMAVKGAFNGIRPVTIGLIGAAAVFVMETVLINGKLFSLQLFTEGADYFNCIPIALFGATVILAGAFKVTPVKLMLIMGIAGALLCG